MIAMAAKTMKRPNNLRRFGSSVSNRATNNAGQTIKPCAEEKLAKTAKARANVRRLEKEMVVNVTENKLGITPIVTKKNASWYAHNQFSL